jgi:hypothetical protein
MIGGICMEELYLKKIKEWYGQSYEISNLESELLYEDDYGTKGYIVGTYDMQFSIINIKIIRMFGADIETIKDLQLSVDLDIRYTSHIVLSSKYKMSEQIRIFMNIIKNTYEVGAKIGMIE